MANPDEYDALKGAGSGAATGSAVAGPWGAVIGGLAGAATPFVSKALGGLFGVDEAEAAQKRAYQGIQRVAEGGTTQAQAGAAYARGRTLQDLQSLASRGTAQQQAGLQRQAMQQAPEVQARYAAQLADLRAMEQERARSQLAYYEGERARQEAARKRASLSNAIESAVTMGTKLGMAAGAPNPADANKLTEAQANAYNAANTKGSDVIGRWNASVANKATAPVSSFGDTEVDNWPESKALAFGNTEVDTWPEYKALQGAAAPSAAVRRAPGIAPAEDMTGSNLDLAAKPFGNTEVDTWAESKALPRSPMADLSGVTRAAKSLAQPKPYGGSTFSSPEVMPSTLAAAAPYYGSQAATGPGPAGAAVGPNLGFAPVQSTAFGWAAQPQAGPPEEPSRWRSYKGKRSPPRGAGGMGVGGTGSF